MIVINFGLCGINIQRVGLLGKANRPLVLVSILIAKVYFLYGETYKEFHSALMGCSNHENFLVENEASIRLAEKKMEDTLRDEYETKYDYRDKQNGELRDKVQRLEKDLSTARNAIRGIVDFDRMDQAKRLVENS